MFAFVGCTNDDLADGTNGSGEINGDVVFIDVAVARPTTANSRSKTDEVGDTNSDATPDYEYGYGYENDVNEVLVVIATVSDGFIASSVVNNVIATPVEKPTQNFDFTATAKFSKSKIEEAYTTLLKDSKKVRIYAYCNPTETLKSTISGLEANSGVTTWTDEKCTVAETKGGTPEANIWQNNGFLMSNARIKEATFPAQPSDWNNYTSEGNPFHLSKNNPDVNIDNGDAGAEKPIYVERAAARIDYYDAATVDHTYELYGTGKVFDGNNGVKDSENGPNLVKVQLTDIMLANMSKEFYYLRRVSADGTSTDWQIGMAETPTNYVVDTDWSAKQTGYTVATASNAFNFPLYKGEAISTHPADGEVYEYNLDALSSMNLTALANNGTKDTWTGENGGKYNIWRYVTENTIPGTDPQKHIQSVGVIFKARMFAGDDVDAQSAKEMTGDENQGKYEAGRSYLSTAVQNALKAAKDGKKVAESTSAGEDEYNYPTIYAIGGLLYAGIDDIIVEATVDGFTYIAEAVLGNWYLEADSATPTSGTFKYAATKPEGDNVFTLTTEIYNLIKHKPGDYSAPEEGIDWTKMEIEGLTDGTNDAVINQILVSKGVTVYKPENGTIVTPEGESKEVGGYFCYYFYWNRHNDNGNNGVMGPMEFATVRNNVYKLSVTKLRQLGHPGDPKDDPTPDKPGDPDEEDVVYIDVKIEVLPWVVRVNNIEF